MIKYINKILRLFQNDSNPGYYVRDTHYYTLYSQYDYLEKLLSDSLPIKEKIYTDLKIQFGPDLEFGLSSKQVRKMLNRPHFTYINKEIKGHQIYFYKRKIYEYKIKMEIHFFNDKFFLGIYNFSEKPNKIDKIVSEIFLKYKINPVLFNNSLHQIADHKDNTIDIEINSKLVVAYIDTCNHDIQLLYRLVVSRKKEAEKRKIDERIKFRDYL